jgi:4-hydroxy-3-polyprenylbenzoate decarboxylase
MPGVLAIKAPKFSTYENAVEEVKKLNGFFSNYMLSRKEAKDVLQQTPFIILCDDSRFTAATLRNFLWVAFTRCNPSHDIYGINEFVEHKHWGCHGPLVIDARIKPHHAPPVEIDPAVEKRIDKLFEKGGSLHGVI